MNKLYTLLLLLLPFLSMTAQNAMFVSFEEQGDFDAVKEIVKSRSYAKVTSEQPNKSIHVNCESFSLDYSFDNGTLYRIVMNREYSNRGNGKQAIDGILNYFESIHAEEIVNQSLGNTKTYVALFRGRVMEMNVIQTTTSDVEVTLSVTYAPTTPLHEKNDYCFQAQTRLGQEELAYKQKRAEHASRLKEVKLQVKLEEIRAEVRDLDSDVAAPESNTLNKKADKKPFTDVRIRENPSDMEMSAPLDPDEKTSESENPNP